MQWIRFRDVLLETKRSVSMDERKALIRQAILQANEVIFEMASRNEQYHNMGTTVVAALLGDEMALLVILATVVLIKWQRRSHDAIDGRSYAC